MGEHRKRLEVFSSVKGSNKQTSLNPLPSVSSVLYVCCTPSCVSASERRVVVSPHYHSPWRGIIPVVIPMALRRQIKVGERKQNKTFRPFRLLWFMMFWGQCENGMVFRWNGFISLCVNKQHVTLPVQWYLKWTSSGRNKTDDCFLLFSGTQPAVCHLFPSAVSFLLRCTSQASFFFFLSDFSWYCGKKMSIVSDFCSL